MITVKQYAEERGITIQAVHQSMQGKRKKERLEGHVTVIDGVKQLDEEAVAILDESRNKSPIVYEKAEANEIIKAMEENEKNYLRKIAEQADRIAVLSDWKAEKSVTIAAADQTKLLLDATKAELEQEKQIHAYDNAAKNQIIASKDAEIQETKQRAETAEAKLAELAAMPKWKKLLIGWKGE